MRTTIALILVLLSVCPLGAQWIERTSSWSAQGLGAFSALVTDPSTDTVYYLSGTTVKSYDPTTDTWTDLDPVVAAGVNGYGSFESAFWSPTGQAGRIVAFYDHAQVDVYDVGTNLWYRNPLPTSTYEFSWAQGALYNPLTETVWCFWTDNVGGNTYDLVGAPYFPATDTWGTVAELRLPEDYYWGRMKSVTIGSTDYTMDDSTDYVGQFAKMRLYDLTQSPAFPVNEPTEYTSVHDLGSGRALSAGGYGIGTSFNTQIMAAVGTDIYLSGVQESDLFLVYHTTTDTWSELPPRPNNDPTQGLRDHNSAAAGGIVYVRDGIEYWTCSPPIFEDGFESGDDEAWSATVP